MAINTSEGTGKEGGVALYILECFDCLELNDGTDRVEHLSVYLGENPTRQI